MLWLPHNSPGVGKCADRTCRHFGWFARRRPLTLPREMLPPTPNDRGQRRRLGDSNGKQPTSLAQVTPKRNSASRKLRHQGRGHSGNRRGRISRSNSLPLQRPGGARMDCRRQHLLAPHRDRRHDARLCSRKGQITLRVRRVLEMFQILPDNALVERRVVSAVLGRSAASTWRDAAHGRLAPPIHIGRSARWRVGDVRIAMKGGHHA